MGPASTRLSDGEEDAKPRTPWISFFLAYAAMAPIVAGAVAVWVFPADALLLARLTVAWSGAVVCFLAGVRRGLSFRQDDGPTFAQIAMMLWLFVLGTGSLLLPWLVQAVALQVLGYATMAVFDPLAAERHETPRYFARLRPVQMLLPIASLTVLLVHILNQ